MVLKAPNCIFPSSSRLSFRGSVMPTEILCCLVIFACARKFSTSSPWMICDVLCAAPIAAQKHKQTAIVHLKTPGRFKTASLYTLPLNCSADRKVLPRRSQYLTPLHSIHRLLRNPGMTEMIEVIKDGEGCGGGNDARGDEGHGYIRLKRTNHDVQGNQEHDNRSGQQHHAVGKRFAKRNHRFLLFNSKASHPRYYRGNW